jgi:hypothetical protein
MYYKTIIILKLSLAGIEPATCGLPQQTITVQRSAN